MQQFLLSVFLLLALLTFFSSLAVTYGIHIRNLQRAELECAAQLLVIQLCMGETPASLSQQTPLAGQLQLGDKTYSYQLRIWLENGETLGEERKGLHCEFPVLFSREPARLEVWVWKEA